MIRPIDMQASIIRPQDVSKMSEVNSDKSMLQDAFKAEMLKQVDKKMDEVVDTNEVSKLVDENGHNKQKNSEKKKKEELDKKEQEEKEKKKKEELDNFQRSMTQRGSRFDFKA